MSRHLAGILVGALLGASIVPAFAQDAVVASPSVYKVLAENDSIRVIQGTYQPGETENWHGHPPYFLYIVDSGRIQVESEGKEPKVYDVKSGQNLMSPHVGKHRGTNLGTEPLRLLIIELKK